MRPIDYRDAKWEEVQKTVTGVREQVYHGLLLHGPCTTMELAAKTGLSVLTVRPRVTELVQMGLAELADGRRGTEGRYRSVSFAEAERRFEAAADALKNNQMRLGI